jgi:hypothetical protein
MPIQRSINQGDQQHKRADEINRFHETSRKIPLGEVNDASENAIKNWGFLSILHRLFELGSKRANVARINREIRLDQSLGAIEEYALKKQIKANGCHSRQISGKTTSYETRDIKVCFV